MTAAVTEKIVALDLETGGTNPDQHQVIQVACIVVRWEQGLPAVDWFEQKVQLIDGKWTEEAMAVNSYNPEVWDMEARPAPAVIDDLSRFFRNHATKEVKSKHGGRFKVAQLLAHNATFDCSFLQAWFKRFGKFLPAATYTGQAFCTLQMAKTLAFLRGKDFENYQLGTLCGAFDIDITDAHDAKGDVEATLALARALTKAFSAIKAG